MNAIGANEVLLPTLQPLELWQQTGRDVSYGENLFKFKDRHGRSLVLGPTHEEVVTEMIRAFVNSYKQLPLTLYQIAPKFRDEFRPRFGLLRVREFSDEGRVQLSRRSAEPGSGVRRHVPRV